MSPKQAAAAKKIELDEYNQISKRLHELANPETAAALRWFFKTGPGEYGEGDVFIGIKVPPLRGVAAEFKTASFAAIDALLQSKIHEERSLAVMILVRQFARADEPVRRQVYDFYLEHSTCINNWDLVDGSAPYITGPYMWAHTAARKQLYVYVKSSSLWERRIAIVSTFYFIRQNDFQDALKISKLLLDDKHDLIHKAVGWMLREIGKRDLKAEQTFLKKHYRKIPRTTLRYAIERFPEALRKKYLVGSFEL
jgi:3-methyladenine DNA glycosylase AlkD